MTQSKNIHVLPTDKSSRLWESKHGRLYLDQANFNDPTECKNKNIYITSDEEIKDGEWFLSDTGVALKYNKNSYAGLISRRIVDSDKKIILTTDQDLIKDGVQAIDDEFLEWFVKNPSCELVEVESFCKYGSNCPSLGAYDKQDLCDVGYKIIIPQEEPKRIKCYCGHTITCDCSPLEEPKQETLEEAAKIYCKNKYGEGYYPDVEKGIEFGARWQANRMYSEEDIISFATWLSNLSFDLQHFNEKGLKPFNELLPMWIEQHKKK